MFNGVFYWIILVVRVGRNIMLKIKNPNYMAPIAAANNDRLTKYAVQIGEYIAGMSPDKKFYTFEEIQTDVLAFNLPDITAADITQEKIVAIALANGLEVSF